MPAMPTASPTDPELLSTTTPTPDSFTSPMTWEQPRVAPLCQTMVCPFFSSGSRCQANPALSVSAAG